MSDNVANMSFTDLVAKLNEIEKRDTAERRKNHKIQVEAAKAKKSKSIKEGLRKALKEAEEIQENVLGMTREEAMPIITPTNERDDLPASLDDYLARFEVGDTVIPKEEGPGQAPGKVIKVEEDYCTVKFADGSTETYRHDELEATDAKNLPEDDTADYEKVNARQMHKQLRMFVREIATLNDKINEISEIDNGDLTDQISTMYKHIQGLYATIGRAQKIVPVYEDSDLEEDDMNEAIPYMYKLQQDGKSIEEIAKELNMTVDAVKSAMSKQHADEGYSKHKKGTKKYKQHMAAMHAAKG